MDTSMSSSSCFRALEVEPSFKNTCSGSSWTWGNYKAFENAVVLYHDDADQGKKFTVAVPGMANEDVKPHYEALRDDVEAIGSGKVPLPYYPSNIMGCEKKEIPLRTGGKQGIHWRDEEHGCWNWTKEEDLTSENALAFFNANPDLWDKVLLAVPGKSIEELKLHYEALILESPKVPLTNNFNKNKACRKKEKPLGFHEQKRLRWTEEEHRSFLSGLEKFGKGDWKSISSYCVPTKTNTQVASHAQKYFTGLNTAKRNQKQSGIKDTPTVNLGSMPSFPTTIMPENISAGKQPPSPKPLGITPDSPFSTQLISKPDISVKGKPTYLDPFWQDDAIVPLGSFSFTGGIPSCSMFAPDLPTRPIQDLSHPVKMPTSALPVSSMQNYVVPPPGSSNAPSTSCAIERDIDIFALPKFIDID